MAKVLPPFEAEKVTMSFTTHLNGGRAFNKSLYSVKYDGIEIGTAVKGRDGDKGVFIFSINGEEYDMTTPLGKEKATIAIKDRFVGLHKERRFYFFD